MSTSFFIWCIRADEPSSYSDAFSRREMASEEMAIRQRERERLIELRKKLDEQQIHLKKLSDHM